MHGGINVVCIESRYIDTLLVDIFHSTHHYCSLKCQVGGGTQDFIRKAKIPFLTEDLLS